MLFAAEQSKVHLKAGSLNAEERKASMVVENHQYNLMADAVGQVGIERTPDAAEVTNVDILLEDGLRGPTVNYTLQRLVDVPIRDFVVLPVKG